MRGKFHIDGDTLIWEPGTYPFVMRRNIDGAELILTSDGSLGIGCDQARYPSSPCDVGVGRETIGTARVS